MKEFTSLDDLLDTTECLLEACKIALKRIQQDIANNPNAKTNRPDIEVKLRDAINSAEKGE